MLERVTGVTKYNEIIIPVVSSTGICMKRLIECSRNANKS